MSIRSRFRACSLGAAFLVVAVSVGGCGSDSESVPSPTFKDDAAAQVAVFKGCVPNERPAPEAFPGQGTTRPEALGVHIQPDATDPDATGDVAVVIPNVSAIGATATPLSASARSSYSPSNMTPTDPNAPSSAPSRVPTVVISPDSKDAKFLFVTYTLKNEGEVTTTNSAQIAPHLLVRTGGKYYAPSVGCNADDEPVAQSYAGEVGAQDPTSGIPPGASDKAVAVYVLPKTSGKLTWVSSDQRLDTVPLTLK